MSRRTISPCTRTLIEARAFLADPQNWCPEGLGRGGVFFDPGTGKRRLCLIQAIAARAESAESRKEAINIVDAVVLRRRYYSIIDANSRGHEVVMSVLSEAIETSIQIDAAGREETV